MAVLDKDTFMTKIKAIVGDDTSDDAMSFIEDMTDTFNDLTSKSTDTEDWKGKYEQLDKEWREKYKARFFEGSSEDDGSAKGGTGGAQDNGGTDEDIADAESVDFGDLFTESEV